MNATEKAVLTNLTKDLRKSTITEWESGDLDDWADYAKVMKTVINTSSSTMEALLSLPTELTPDLSKESNKDQTNSHSELIP
jgi:hypothetical protein